MITLTLNCANVDELHQTLRDILKGEPSTRPTKMTVAVGPLTPEQATTVKEVMKDNPAVTSMTEVQVESAAETAQPEKKTRTRKPKETKPQEMNEAVALEPFETIKQESNSSPSLEVNASIPTKDQVHQALQQVNVALGLPAAREILKKFNVQRQSEIQPSQYRPFIEECNNVVAMS